MNRSFEIPKIKICFYLLALGVLIISSCSKEEMEPEVEIVDMCAGTNYTYTDDLKSLFDTKCTPCHDGSTQLSDYTSYEGIFEDRILMRDAIILGFEEVTNNRVELSQEEQDLILCWINKGAKE